MSPHPIFIHFDITKVLGELLMGDSARLLLLHTPHAGTFCAGADLRERRTMSPTQVSSFLDSLRSLISELEGVQVPSIGVVDGYALGGGTEIALGCDLRVGGKSPHSHPLPYTRTAVCPCPCLWRCGELVMQMVLREGEGY